MAFRKVFCEPFRAGLGVFWERGKVFVQPFASAPWNYLGVENWSNLPANTVDWVLLEARSKNNPSQILKRRAGLLQSDGQIMDVDGTSGLTFYGLDTD